MRALGNGSQIFLLRKGGIAEGRGGFAAKHSDFWLLPTRFHAQPDKIRPEFRSLADEQGQEEPETVEIEFVARLCWSRFLEDWKSVRRLAAFQLWEESVLRERFAYGGKEGLHLLTVRVYRSGKTVLPWGRALRGCRSWVTVEHSWSSRLVPVVAEEEFLAREKELRVAVEVG